MSNDIHVCVIGGANIDISGKSHMPLIHNDSNIGKIELSFGGVGNNIADNLSRLGIKTELIAAFGDDDFSQKIGDDDFSQKICNNCEKNGIKLENSLIIPSEKASAYLYIQDSDGEMQLAVSDMDVCNNLTPLFLSKKLDIINGCQACVIDANIPKESIEYLTTHCSVPIFLDTVSRRKTEKIKDIINNLYAIKPNLLELEIISDLNVVNIESKNERFGCIKKAAQKILSKNIKQIFVSMGKDGVYYFSKDEEGYVPCISVPVVSTSGAGDSFLSGVIWAYLNKMSLKESAVAGTALSAICVKSPSSVSKDLSLETLNSLMKTAIL
ncbi:MAG: carbohydrate kinase family protein [Oscillospiraceae bacterium]|jgi:pseudouridine kinase|nr:carbohydrate kinase family protein [Oscillospiraceae bacterium]